MTSFNPRSTQDIWDGLVEAGLESIRRKDEQRRLDRHVADIAANRRRTNSETFARALGPHLDQPEAHTATPDDNLMTPDELHAAIREDN
jgi:hypothetical protein